MDPVVDPGARSILAKRLLVVVAVLFALAVAFYFVQNANSHRGGAVAPVKALWLFTVIVFWYVLPLFWAADKSLPTAARAACAVVAGNMLLRAMVELGLMYGSGSWLHSYGIGHDIFSALLCLGLAGVIRSPRWLSGYFLYSAVLFGFEVGFASYLQKVSDGDGSVFFVSSAPEHQMILQTTGIVVGVSVVIAAILLWRWTHAKT